MNIQTEIKDYTEATVTTHEVDGLRGKLERAEREVARLREDLDGTQMRLLDAHSEIYRLPEALPATYYAGLRLEERIKLLVDDWRTLTKANQMLEAEIARLRAKYQIAFAALTSLRNSPVAVEALQACIDYDGTESRTQTDDEKAAAHEFVKEQMETKP